VTVTVIVIMTSSCTKLDYDSEGEFYETSDNLIGDGDSDRNHDIKLH
jgi:hypothetical protein